MGAWSRSARAQASRELAVTRMSLSPGQIIDGKYRIVRELGVGGMGAVYEGENTRIHRRVAIKVLHAQVATKADIVQRFVDAHPDLSAVARREAVRGLARSGSARP